MCVFSAKIWFVKALTRIVKYESQVIKSNPVGEYSTYGTYGGATFQLGDFGDLKTASEGYKNSKFVPGRVMIFEKLFIFLFTLYLPLTVYKSRP